MLVLYHPADWRGSRPLHQQQHGEAVRRQTGSWPVGGHLQLPYEASQFSAVRARRRGRPAHLAEVAQLRDAVGSQAALRVQRDREGKAAWRDPRAVGGGLVRNDGGGAGGRPTALVCGRLGVAAA